MNRIQIGSLAARQWFEDFPRIPKDSDYAVDSKEYKSSRQIEYLYNPILFQEKYADLVFEGRLVPDALYTLKMSHIFWNIQFSKHIFDIQWLKDKGCKVIREL